MLGRFIGKSLLENWNIEVTFSKIFLKHILGKNLILSDLEEIDQEITKSILWIL